MFPDEVKRARKHKAPKLPFSFKRQILPPLLGIAVMSAVFAGLNGQYLMAQYRYHTIKPVANVQSTPHSTNPSSDNPTKIDASLPPSLDIPSIKVKAPIIMDEQSYIEWKVQKALQKGVVHYGQTAVPGQRGNVVILGHSSGQPWAPGDYKFVFTLLDKLQKGDTIHLNYQGTRYTYTVADSTVVKPDDVSVLKPTDKPTLSLITCTPVGTSKNRLVVHAVQTSPTIDQEMKQHKQPAPTTSVSLPGSDTSTSLWDRVRTIF